MPSAQRVAALIAAGLVDDAVIAQRLATVPIEHRAAAERALAWLGFGS